MIENFPGGQDPLQQLFELDLATPSDIEFATILAGDILKHGPYTVARSHTYFTENDQYLILVTIENVEDGTTYYTTNACLYGNDESDNPRMGVEFDESGSMLDQTLDGSDCVMIESAAIAEDMLRQILEHNKAMLSSTELAIIDRLILFAQGVQGNVSLAEYAKRSDQVNMSDAINSVIAENKPLPVKTTTISGVLEQGTTIMLLENEFLTDESLRGFDENNTLKRQIEVKPPDTRTIDCLLEYFNGDVRYDPYNPAYDDQDDEAYELSHEVAEEAGLYRPPHSALERMTRALVDFSLSESFS